MLQDRSLAAGDLGHRVGQRCRPAVGSDVGLDDPRLALRLGEDQVARMRNGGTRARQRDEDEVDRLFQDRPARDPDESAVAKECGIERSEGLADLGRDPSEMGLDRAFARERLPQADGGGRPESAAGEFRGVRTVDEDDARSPFSGDRDGFREGRVGLLRELEGGPHDRRGIRVLPRLVSGGREPRLLEARHGVAPQGRDPRRLSVETALGECRQRGGVEVVGPGDGFHQDTAARAEGGSFSSHA